MNYTLKVVEKRIETHDTVTLCFKQPGLKKIKYEAGQYLTLIFRINGRRYSRPYSFSSCPGIDSLLEVTIKRVFNGVVSNHIHDKVAVGDSIEVMQPMGDFVLQKDKIPEEIYLWCVGSGITPLFSLAKSILLYHPQTLVNLIYGNKSTESTIFWHSILDLKYKYPENFQVLMFQSECSDKETTPNIKQGRIDVEEALSNLSKTRDSLASFHYICGPNGLKESAKRILGEKGIPNTNILSEDFELVKDPKEFEDVNTQIVTLSFNKKEYTLEVPRGRSILEAALDGNIELPYSCQTGQCSTCIGKLIRGDAKMVGLDIMRDDLEKGAYLLCCTHPLNENVYIEI